LRAIHVGRFRGGLSVIAAGALAVPFVVAVAAAPVAAAAGTTITVDEVMETATFSPAGPGGVPLGNSTITSVTNNDGKCSLREAIEAANTNTKVDSCPAGTPGRDTIVIPAGTYEAWDNFFVAEPIDFVGANVGKAGYDPSRGPESIIQLRFNPFWLAQIGLFWLNGTGSIGIGGAGSTFDGLVMEGTPESPCGPSGVSPIPCEATAIVLPAQGAQNVTAPGYQVRNSIVRDFSEGMYLGGTGGIVERNLFLSNDRFLGAGASAAAGVDVYSDQVYPTANTTIQDNRFDQPKRAGIDLEGLESGQVIQRNVISTVENLAATNAMILFGTQNITVFDNLVADTSPPPVTRRGIVIANSQNLHLTGNTIVGNLYGIRVGNFAPAFPVVSGVVIENNRIYSNVHGLSVAMAEAIPPGAIVANPGNWWGSNGGPGSTGARPGAPNPVNDVILTNTDGTVVPNTGQVVINDWLRLTCTVANPSITVGQSTDATGAVLGMPVVNQPLFTSFAQPVMDGSVTGGIGTVAGFGALPSNGVLGGQVLGGATLTGSFTATAAGTGSVDVALDSEQVSCPITVAAAPTTPPTEPPTTAPTTTPSVAPTMPATLPPTGSGSGAPLYLGIVLFVLGAFVVTVTTRRRATRS
jgi:CSLREA domain-containing protein